MKENKSIALKGNGGITLIALVITIIVLIILAGISIAMISGQDGIIKKAGSGAAANQLGAAKDKCALLATEATQDVYENVYVKNTGAQSAINDTIDATAEAKIYGAKAEIGKLLGDETNGVKVYDAAGAAIKSSTVPGTLPTKGTSKTVNKILLTYSDGTAVTGTLNAGKITWEDGDQTK